VTIATSLIEQALRAWRPARVVRPGSVEHTIATALYGALVGSLPDALRPLVSGALSSLDTLSQRVTVTIATPLDPVIVMSPAAVADPITEACTLCHEWEHVSQIAHSGRAQTVVDYLGSGELRAQREADAAAAGLWMRYVLTGALPDDAPSLADLYRLDAGDAALARSIIASHLATIRAGVCPPLDVCVRLAQWLHATPLDVPDEVRARVPRVPS